MPSAPPRPGAVGGAAGAFTVRPCGRSRPTGPSVHTAAVTHVRRPHPYLDHPAPIPFAHRGGAADGLENTAAAFRRAAAAGYRYFETDVHATADGKLVAFHDATLDRVTDATGRIRELSWSRVREARVAGSEPLPLFEELLEEFPDARWNVDVKDESALYPLVNLVARAGVWDRVCVGSFSESRVARAQKIAGPRLATSYGVRGVLGLRLRSWAIPAALRVGAVAARCRRPRRASGWSTGGSYGPRTSGDSRCTCGP